MGCKFFQLFLKRKEKLLSVALIVSINPGSEPIIPANSTGAQITELHYAFDTASALFNEYDRTDKALRQILLSAVDKMFIRSLRHKYVGYGLTTTRTILDHYTPLTPTSPPPYLQENDAVFCTPYYINQPIESLFDRVENCGDYAATGNTTYSLEKVIGFRFSARLPDRSLCRQLQSLETSTHSTENLDWLQNFLRNSAQRMASISKHHRRC